MVVSAYLTRAMFTFLKLRGRDRFSFFDVHSKGRNDADDIITIIITVKVKKTMWLVQKQGMHGLWSEIESCFPQFGALEGDTHQDGQSLSLSDM